MLVRIEQCRSQGRARCSCTTWLRAARTQWSACQHMGSNGSNVMPKLCTYTGCKAHAWAWNLAYYCSCSLLCMLQVRQMSTAVDIVDCTSTHITIHSSHSTTGSHMNFNEYIYLTVDFSGFLQHRSSVWSKWWSELVTTLQCVYIKCI
jgi:hypothetical protein